MSRRMLAFALLLAGVGFAADPPRPDPKLYPDKWEKGGVSVEVEEGVFSKDTCALMLRVTNGGKADLNLKADYLDEAFMKSGKPDPKSELAGVSITDELGDRKQATARGLAIKGVEKPRAVKAGESAVITVAFERPAVSGRYFLTVPADASGLPGEVKMVVPADKFKPKK